MDVAEKGKGGSKRGKGGKVGRGVDIEEERKTEEVGGMRL